MMKMKITKKNGENDTNELVHSKVHNNNKTIAMTTKKVFTLFKNIY